MANEVRQIREKSVRPKYGPKFIARVVKLMATNDIGILATRIGVGRDTLQRWQSQAPNRTRDKAAASKRDKAAASKLPTFSPVLPQRLPETTSSGASEAEQMIRLDFSYRDGRRMVLELPATKACCQDLLGSLRQDFFRGC